VIARDDARRAHEAAPDRGQIVPRSAKTGVKNFFWIPSQNPPSTHPMGSESSESALRRFADAMLSTSIDVVDLIEIRLREVAERAPRCRFKPCEASHARHRRRSSARDDLPTNDHPP